MQLFGNNNNQVKETEPAQGNEMEQPPKGEETDLSKAKESELSTLPVVHHDETSNTGRQHDFAIRNHT